MMITILAWIVLIATLAQFLVALANLLWHEQMIKGKAEKHELVSILIPARNEQENIGCIIRDILEQDHSHFELIVCDDQSEDNTADIVREYMNRDERISLISKDHLPDGWLGKNHACHTLSEAARGNYLLFLDADVRISGDIITQSVLHTKKHQLSLISIFPSQIMKSAGEWMTVPVMNFILLTLLPLILVRRSNRPSLSAANGQFMFFEARDYREIHPHQAMKANRVEDIAIARLYKEKALNISCQTGDERVKCRMYTGYNDAIRGFSRNVIDFFGGSAILAILFWLVTTLGVIPVIMGLSLPLIILWAVLFLFTRVLVSLRSKQRSIKNIIFLIPQQLSMGFFIFNGLFRSRTGKHAWKGRKI